MEGFLVKRGGFVKNWKRRWFVVRENTLYYLLQENSPSPRGTIPLTGAIFGVVPEDQFKRSYVFCVTPAKSDRTYYIQCESAAACVDWIRCLCATAQIELPQNLDDYRKQHSISLPIIEESFEQNEVVPDVVSAAPLQLSSASFGSAEVKLGNEINKEEAQSAPAVQWEGDKDKLYTVVMVDPDAPSRDNAFLRCICHWVVINVKGSDLSTGEEHTAYAGPAPPEGSGLHRYVLLVYEQSGKLESKDIEVNNRVQFSIDKIAAAKGMKLIAGNFFQSQTKQ